MIWSQEAVPVASAEEAKDLALAQRIAGQLKRRYGWVDIDELYSYALWGLTQARECYDSARGMPFSRFATCKGMYLAIDEMRKDGILRRANSKSPIQFQPLTTAGDDGQTTELDPPDERAERAAERLEAREMCRTLLARLRTRDRQLVMMYYGESMTFREIAEVLEISESAVCLRHQAVLRRLRRMAKCPND